MRFIGYYPGVDFGDPSQFGRVIHTQNFIQNYHSAIDPNSLFIVGRENDFDHESVQELGFGDSIISKLIRDLIGISLLLKIVLTSDDRIVVYSRDSPYLSKLLIGLHPRVCLVLEVNGLANTEGGQSTMSAKLYQWIREKSRNRSALLICVSEGIKEELQTRDNKKHIAVVENGVDTELFSPDSEQKANDGEQAVCYVGSLQPWQGVEEMLEVLSLVDRELRFYVVGGTISRQKELQENAKSLGIEGQVEFVGRVSHSMVPSYINKADVCFGPFNASRQASPMKIYEYLACGKSVILVNDSGLEYVEDYPGVHRFSSDMSDQELAAHLNELLSGNSSNIEGREYIEKNRSWSSVVSRIRELIDQSC
ncbi:glycosyltransferase family 4 protein [Halosimplex pelagicum]|uniref:Glycosyltransferase family 4 protein n=1 Tax=Halosimplex pelagicum TaxID=869886 RepID=A0A7D5PA76_9EURY|nr:glycosyltransferase family 4 protein [Halosimplex pelagicum]QLH81342.1 glycosyltransferase family 4 protein [Halosimplex pelagicum]